ncbi:MAG TPA: helix-turn-helix domain-containing protein, partial [Gaiellaceae bacterium]
ETAVKWHWAGVLGRSPACAADCGETIPKLRAQEIEDAEAFGARLRDARRRAGLTQRELAFRGCTAAYISRMETGGRVPSLEIVRQLADRLGISEGFLLGTHGDAGLHPSSRDVRGELALRLGRIDEARAVFDEALREPLPLERRVEALEGLGRAALRAGQPQRAVELFEQAAAEAKVDVCDRPACAEDLARAHARCGAVSSAIALLRRCTGGPPTAGDGRLLRMRALLGALLMDAGDTRGASEVLAAAVAPRGEVLPLNARARSHWARAIELLDDSRLLAAEEHLHRGLEASEAQLDALAAADALRRLAALADADERHDEALALLGEASAAAAQAACRQTSLEVELRAVKIVLGRGARDDAWRRLGELSSALADPQARSRRALLLAGEVFAELGETGRAEDLYRAASELADGNGNDTERVEAFRRLAQLLKDAGQTDEAFEILDRALAFS